MNPETKQTAQIILSEIAKARKYTEIPDAGILFLSSEALISGMATLIGPLMDLETAYRQTIRGYIADGDSHATAEAKARAGQEYSAWKKLQYVYELAGDQIMLIKKFSGELQKEYQRTK